MVMLTGHQNHNIKLFIYFCYICKSFEDTRNPTVDLLLNICFQKAKENDKQFSVMFLLLLHLVFFFFFFLAQLKLILNSNIRLNFHAKLNQWVFCLSATA